MEKQKLGDISYADFGLDLIMNPHKVSRKNDSQSLNRLHKAFQILEHMAVKRFSPDQLEYFAEFLEIKAKDIILSFEKERNGKFE